MTTPTPDQPTDHEHSHRGCSCSHAKTPSEAFSRIWPIPLLVVGLGVIAMGFAEWSALKVFCGTFCLWVFSEIRKGQKTSKGGAS